MGGKFAERIGTVSSTEHLAARREFLHDQWQERHPNGEFILNIHFKTYDFKKHEMIDRDPPLCALGHIASHMGVRSSQKRDRRIIVAHSSERPEEREQLHLRFGLDLSKPHRKDSFKQRRRNSLEEFLKLCRKEKVDEETIECFLMRLKHSGRFEDL